MDQHRIQIGEFARYPPEAKALAAANLIVLQRLPLVFLSQLLRQIIQFDWCFPAERRQLTTQLDLLRSLDAKSLDQLMAGFAAIPLSADLRKMDPVGNPQQFSEQLTAYLWSQHLIDNFHSAAQEYDRHLQAAVPVTSPGIPRWTIVLVGHGSEQSSARLFHRLMPHGTLFTQVDATGGLEVLLAEAASRARQHPQDYAHWYIDGGELHPSAATNDALTRMAYTRLVPAAKREFDLLQRFTAAAAVKGSVGVEAVGSFIAQLTPEEMGLKGTVSDAALRHFEVNLLTQGAGCQIYSTTFVQWAARECLHRAQPLTLVARFSTRQMSAPMEQLLERDPLQQPQDKEGSLVDADMGAYYTWINQSRLPGASESRFLVWHEGHSVACAIAPTLPGGTTSSASASMRQLLDWMR